MMLDKESLNTLSHDELVFIADKALRNLNYIGETIVSYDKMHISADQAIESTRQYLSWMPANVESIKTMAKTAQK